MKKAVEATISRRQFSGLLFSVAAAMAVLAASAKQLEQGSDSGQPFVHPGMLQTREDLERMGLAVRQRQEPIFSGFEKLRAHPLSQLNYRSKGASAEIGRNPNVRSGDFDSDCNAAYQCAVMWCITQEHAYADLAIGIVDNWSAELRTISGADAVLCAALGGFKMANAAELLRHTDSGWPAERAERFNGMLRDVFLPVIVNFAAFANGNWDTAAMKMMMAIAVFGDDRPLFERAMVYYGRGCGDGRATYYIYANGECQESGRDQQHTQLGLGHMGDCCEVAWNQGLDLYGAVENRLLTGFEYTAKYNLGEDVPFIPDNDRTGKYHHEVISPRSRLRPVYEQIWNHYVQRRGLAAPWTEEAAEKLRPEGAGPGADQTGFGTLLYTRPRNVAPPRRNAKDAPAGVYVVPEAKGVRVDFTPLASGIAATISRRDVNGKRYRVIVRDLKEGSYLDRSTVAGQLYTYRVERGSSNSLPATTMAGLPAGWRQEDVGQLPAGSAAAYDGSKFRLTAAGERRIDQGGGYTLLQRETPEDTVFVARILPLFASQFLQAGVALWIGDAEHLLLLQPSGGPTERPAWLACLLGPGTDQGLMQMLGQQRLPEPTVRYGRVMLPVWFALESRKGTVRAGLSLEGKAWSLLGSGPAAGGRTRAGLVLSSGIGAVTTELCFDSVSVKPTAAGSVLDGAASAITQS